MALAPGDIPVENVPISWFDDKPQPSTMLIEASYLFWQHYRYVVTVGSWQKMAHIIRGDIDLDIPGSRKVVRPRK